MTYTFKCEQCNNIETKTIAIDDYDKEKNNQICSKCNGHMQRVIEFDGSVGLCSGCYGIDNPANSWNS
jgi:predicted nucleic acid-binding Zn ribbon protein